VLFDVALEDEDEEGKEVRGRGAFGGLKGSSTRGAVTNVACWKELPTS
jgi:hypothetical protein